MAQWSDKSLPSPQVSPPVSSDLRLISPMESLEVRAFPDCWAAPGMVNHCLLEMLLVESQDQGQVPLSACPPTSSSPTP